MASTPASRFAGGTRSNPQGVASDAGRSSRCQTAVLAFTKDGSYTIETCAVDFKRLFDRDRRVAELVIIHELLHSLGLGENPPTDSAINARVAARCG